MTNSAGDNTLTKDDYVSIGGFSLPFSDDFESGSLSAGSWTVENPDLLETWEIAEVGGNQPGNSAASMDFIDYTTIGATDRLISPILSFDNFDQVFLSFEHAFVRRWTSATDSLIIYISTDCSNNWERLSAYGEDGNGSFATHELMTSSFVPAEAEDWCGAGWGASCIVVDLSAWAGQDNIKIAFETYNYYGNALFIDNVTVGPLTNIAANNTDFDQVQVFPNPTSGVFNLWIPGSDENSEIRIFNIQGVEILQVDVEEMKSGENIQLDLSGFVKGVYFIRISNNTETMVKKIIRN